MIMISISLYSISDSDNKLVKTLSNPYVIRGEFNNSVDIIMPVIRVGVDVSDYNYCYISSIGKYYFIRDYTIYRDNYYLVTLELDVLMTYHNDILDLDGSVVSSDNANPYYNGYIDSYDVRQTHTTYEFDNNFVSEGVNILIGVRGVTNVS